MFQHLFEIALSDGSSRHLVARVDPDRHTRSYLADQLLSLLKEMRGRPAEDVTIINIVYHGPVLA